MLKISLVAGTSSPQPRKINTCVSSQDAATCRGSTRHLVPAAQAEQARTIFHPRCKQRLSFCTLAQQQVAYSAQKKTRPGISVGSGYLETQQSNHIRSAAAHTHFTATCCHWCLVLLRTLAAMRSIPWNMPCNTV